MTKKDITVGWIHPVHVEESPLQSAYPTGLYIDRTHQLFLLWLRLGRLWVTARWLLLLAAGDSDQFLPPNHMSVDGCYNISLLACSLTCLMIGEWRTHCDTHTPHEMFLARGPHDSPKQDIREMENGSPASPNPQILVSRSFFFRLTLLELGSKQITPP